MKSFPFFASKKALIILAAIAALAAAMLIFKAGEALGERKARFSYRWGENYHRMFGGPAGGWLKDFSGRNFLNDHGVSGAILAIDGTTLMVASSNNTEQTVLVTNTTVIRRGRATLTLTDLRPDARAVIIGKPNAQGQIEAKFIRVFDTPAPPTTSTNPN